jgi:hypothetical protein
VKSTTTAGCLSHSTVFIEVWLEYAFLSEFHQAIFAEAVVEVGTALRRPRREHNDDTRLAVVDMKIFTTIVMAVLGVLAFIVTQADKPHNAADWAVRGLFVRGCRSSGLREGRCAGRRKPVRVVIQDARWGMLLIIRRCRAKPEKTRNR